MDTAMVQRIRINKSCLILLVLWFMRYSYAADVVVTPRIESKFTYTDNVNLTSEDKRSSNITSLIAGLKLKSDGNNGNLSLDYQIEQLLYSYDSDKDKLYNKLSFSADKGLFSKINLRGKAIASVSNVARSIKENANTDVSTENTIESRNVGVGLSYQSNPSGVMDLLASIDSSLTDNEDSVGDNTTYTGQIVSKQGRAVKKYFWSVDYDYKATVGKEDEKSTGSSELDQKFGLQPVNRFSPLVHLYYEEYSGQTDDDSADSSSWGPGVRYYIDKRSYIELGYDFVLDGDNSDFWRGGVHLNPSEKTVLDFNYTKRFYGNAYAFSLTHKTRRLTNSIFYVEEVTNYNRELYVEGSQIEQLTISKKLSWLSSLALRRTTVNLEVSSEKQKSMNSLSIQSANVDKYSSKLSLEHHLTRQTTLSPGFEFESYDFYNQGQITQEDYYRNWSIAFTKNFASDLSMNLDLSYKDRSSTNSNDAYQESRISINIRKEL
ncbi:TIGR03016 family PEP-CTERM system-associated outer membrane protein [Vibrio salinus]|uniref:TIGR03016 family PEP-CTERM system-associated outer membrane protein n=1 Tax=Vibrio salinus TaxID=2899784 RepID=UPI001E2B9142|nr:TIGR03016 family PEP-CTERM system-associated outer membrane protein [Vibrio salinus]MCE0493256.1 TIGR03016 family PEP-CTERM system-associated outer membrane protein [Vibrio salinus]